MNEHDSERIAGLLDTDGMVTDVGYPLNPSTLEGVALVAVATTLVVCHPSAPGLIDRIHAIEDRLARPASLSRGWHLADGDDDQGSGSHHRDTGVIHIALSARMSRAPC